MTVDFMAISLAAAWMGRLSRVMPKAPTRVVKTQ